MVELKLSQGIGGAMAAKLPALKVSREISLTRGVPMGEDCISPSSHSAFSTPVEMMRFIAEMCRLSGGKPAGFKLSSATREFWPSETCWKPASIRFHRRRRQGGRHRRGADGIHRPYRGRCARVCISHNALVGIGARGNIKIASPADHHRLRHHPRQRAGRRWCIAARGFMFAVGCIQSDPATSTPPDRRRHPGPDPSARWSCRTRSRGLPTSIAQRCASWLK
jgi:hypothetical protein